MKIVCLSQTHYKNPNVNQLTVNQLRSIIVKEILVFPDSLPLVNNSRIKNALRELKKLKDSGEIKESVGNMIMDAIDHFLFESSSPIVKKLTGKQKTDMTENALSLLSRLMKEVVKE